MGLRDGMRSVFLARPQRTEERDIYPYSLQAYINDVFGYNGVKYALTPGQRSPVQIPDNFEGLSEAQRCNAIVFACMAVRLRVFSEVRFGFRNYGDVKVQHPTDGRNPASGELDLLRHPWPGGTTGDLLGRMLQHADLGGNAFVLRQPRRLRMLRPDWVTIVFSGNMDALTSEVIGYVYQPGGRFSEQDPVVLTVDQVAHFAPMPDPMSPWRGMSWLTTVIPEVRSDNEATEHKLEFFTNGATGTMVVTLNNPALNSEDKFNKVVEEFKKRHRAVDSAYDVLFFANGADAKVIGSDLQQSDYKSVVGAGETRIAAAAGVPPILVGLSEGLAASTYSNYGQARRAFADEWARPMWRNVCGSLEQIVASPSGMELWTDESDVAFLREDAKDQAQIQQVNAATMKSLIDAGFVPDDVVQAVASGDFTQMRHTGLYSVQLQPPMTVAQPQPAVQAGRALAQLVAQYLPAETLNGAGG